MIEFHAAQQGIKFIAARQLENFIAVQNPHDGNRHRIADNRQRNRTQRCNRIGGREQMQKPIRTDGECAHDEIGQYRFCNKLSEANLQWYRAMQEIKTDGESNQVTDDGTVCRAVDIHRRDADEDHIQYNFDGGTA